MVEMGCQWLDGGRYQVRSAIIRCQYGYVHPLQCARYGE